MPFQSEKQRRYMHANLPRIAKRWERDYANGGIASQGGMKNYLGEQPMVNAPKYWQSAPDHEMTELAYITPKERDVLVNMNMYGTMDGSPNEGPSGIMSLNGWGDASQGFGTSGGGTKGTGGHSYGDKERYKSVDVQGPPNIHGGTTRTIGPTTPKDHFTQRYTGSGWFGGGNKYGYNDIYMYGPKQGQTKPGWGGRILGGLASLVTGIPFIGGAIGSTIDHYKPKSYWDKLPDSEKRRLNALNITPWNEQKLTAPKGSEQMRSLQNLYKMRSLIDQSLTNKLSIPKYNLDPSNMRMMEVANNPALSRYKQRQGLASFNDPWAGPTVQQVGWEDSQKNLVQKLKDLGFSAKDAYEKLSKKNVSPQGMLNPFKTYPNALQPEEFYDKWYGGSFDQLPSNKKGYEVPQDVDTQIQNIYKDYI